MLTTVATVLAVLIGVGIIGVGVRLLCAPAEAATGFGILDTPTADPALRSWLAVKAVRDVVSGLLLLVIILVGTPHVLGWFATAAEAARAWGWHAPRAGMVPARGYRDTCR